MDNERLPTLRLLRQASLAAFRWIECLRLYDMILAHGTNEVYENKEKMTGYKLFTGYASDRTDGKGGFDRPLILCKQDRAGVGTFLPNNAE